MPGSTLQRTLAGKARFNHPKVKQVRSGTLHLLKKMLATSPKKRPKAQKGCKAGEERPFSMVFPMFFIVFGHKAPLSRLNVMCFKRLLDPEALWNVGDEEVKESILAIQAVQSLPVQENDTESFLAAVYGAESMGL